MKKYLLLFILLTVPVGTSFAGVSEDVDTLQTRLDKAEIKSADDLKLPDCKKGNFEKIKKSFGGCMEISDRTTLMILRLTAESKLQVAQRPASEKQISPETYKAALEAVKAYEKEVGMW